MQHRGTRGLRRRVVIVISLVVIVVLVGGQQALTQPGATSMLKQLRAVAVRDVTETDGLRAVPGPNEAGEINDRVAEQFAQLAYPGHTFPGDWQTRARDHIRQYVRDGDPYASQRSGVGVPGSVLPPSLAAWNKVGPAPIDANAATDGYKYGLVTGRINAIAVDPVHPTTAYAGATAGGLWKTTNCCSTSTRWTPLWETKDQVSQSVGAIEIDPTNPDVIYVGTGDFDGRDQYGVGMMKTSDGGATWSLLGGGTNGIFTPFNSVAHGPTDATPPPDENFGAIKVDPRNPSTVVTGTTYGFFLSRDGGTSWTQVDVADPTAIQRVSSIVLDGSTNPSTLYVALGYPYTAAAAPSIVGTTNGIYKATLSANANPAFQLISTDLNGWPAATGNCGDACTVGRIRLAESTRTPGLIYAQVSDYNNVNALGTWVTTNGGSSWTHLQGSGDAAYTDCTMAQSGEQQDWYDLFIGIDPQDDHRLSIGRTSVYRAVVSADFKSFTSLTNLGSVYSTTCPGYGTIHPDEHAIAWLADGRFLIGNDGGMYVATGQPGGFTALNNDLNVTQFYNGQLGPNYGTSGSPADGRQYAFGGAQDNGNESWSSANSDLQWQARANGGDGFFVAFDPVKGSVTNGTWYTEYTYGKLYCSTAGAQGAFGPCWGPWYTSARTHDRTGFSTPYTLDTLHCAAATVTVSCPNLAVGTNMVYATGTGGISSDWSVVSPDVTKCPGFGCGSSNVITDLRFAPGDPRVAVVGTGDGNVQWTATLYNAGPSCSQAAVNTEAFTCTPNLNAGWVDLTGGNTVLPNRAILGVSVSPADSQVVYAAVGGFNTNTPGTPGHVFQARCASACDTATNWTWNDKTGNLPDVPAATVLANPRNPQQVFVGTHFGFYYTDNIEAAVPVWQRFQTGLPNTVIQYLTIDRGNTTLGAFTYGRGLYTIKLPDAGSSFGGGHNGHNVFLPSLVR